MTNGIKVKNLLIGGGAPISVQSMTNTDTADVERTLAQIDALDKAGCDLCRIAVSSEKELNACKNYVRRFSMPLCADIQFDYKLAIGCVEIGFDKIRINPGYIGEGAKLREVIDACKAANVPVRVGVNMGSVSESYLSLPPEEAIARCALDSVRAVEKCGYDNIVVSAKASDVVTCIKAYRIISKSVNYPLHVGVTESGTTERAIVRSSVGIGALLVDGIGDTLRVSLTGDPVKEVKAGRMLLQEIGIDKNFCSVVSCPTCSRCKYDLESIALAVKEKTAHITKPIKVAVMGCAVNGPGEARDADVGVAGGNNGKAVLFRKGKIVKTVDFSDIMSELMKLIEELI